ncbi:hypothetical protein BN1708_003820 [Verticillium longisporum]|uniref:Uncharacterized protein n=1 Tax=Verticillium longisporum TaxID=100787 RepID=A0A0G4LR10_VERLO|nr:hypothetical protein BN1708_003820 [Verticillium longisporum]
MEGRPRAMLVRGVLLLIRLCSLPCSMLRCLLALSSTALAFCMARWASFSRGRMMLSAPLQKTQMRPSGMRMMMDMRLRLLVKSMTSKTWSIDHDVAEVARSFNEGLLIRRRRLVLGLAVLANLGDAGVAEGKAQ